MNTDNKTKDNLTESIKGLFYRNVIVIIPIAIAAALAIIILVAVSVF